MFAYAKGKWKLSSQIPFYCILKKNYTFDKLLVAIKTFYYLQVRIENLKRYVSWFIINKSLPALSSPSLTHSPVLRPPRPPPINGRTQTKPTVRIQSGNA